MNDFSLIVLSFRCYAIHKYIHRFWGAQYNVRYIPRDQEAVSSLQSAVLSRQSAVCCLQLNGHPFMGAKTWLFKPGRLNCPDFQVAGRSWSVGSLQSAVRSRQSAVSSSMATLSWAQKPGFSSQADWIAPTFKSRAAHDQSAVLSGQFSVGSLQSTVDAVIGIQYSLSSIQWEVGRLQWMR